MIKEITLPAFLIQPRKTKADKRYSLDLNQYRNWNFRVSNILKVQFKEENKDLFDFKASKINSIKYQITYPDKGRHDKMNIISVVDKFLMDALVEYGCIPDDNDNYIGEVIILRSLYEKGVRGRSYVKVIIDYDR